MEPNFAAAAAELLANRTIDVIILKTMCHRLSRYSALLNWLVDRRLDEFDQKSMELADQYRNVFYSQEVRDVLDPQEEEVMTP